MSVHAPPLAFVSTQMTVARKPKGWHKICRYNRIVVPREAQIYSVEGVGSIPYGAVRVEPPHHFEMV